MEETEKDIEELMKLETVATRSHVKDFLKFQIQRLQTELTKQQQLNLKKEPEASAEPAAANPVRTPSQHSIPKTYKELIKNYGWDQSDKFMKLYVTLQGVHTLDKDAVTTCFTDHSVQMDVKGLNGKDCELTIARLAEKIDSTGSYHKVKTDSVLVMLKKKQSGKTWTYVTEKEKLAKEMKSKPPAMDKDADPSASLMGLLQNMYEDGDDEMKRMIKKAMFESQNKRGSEFTQ